MAMRTYVGCYCIGKPCIFFGEVRMWTICTYIYIYICMVIHKKNDVKVVKVVLETAWNSCELAQEPSPAESAKESPASSEAVLNSWWCWCDNHIFGTSAVMMAVGLFDNPKGFKFGICHPIGRSAWNMNMGCPMLVGFGLIPYRPMSRLRHVGKHILASRCPDRGRAGFKSSINRSFPMDNHIKNILKHIKTY